MNIADENRQKFNIETRKTIGTLEKLIYDGNISLEDHFRLIRYFDAYSKSMEKQLMDLLKKELETDSELIDLLKKMVDRFEEKTK